MNKPEKPSTRSLRQGRISIPGQVYFVTSSTDRRQQIFTNFHASCTACRCFENNIILGDAIILAWVLMPDHAHWLLQLGERDSLDRVMNRIKSSSARQVNQVLQRKGKLWQATYHDHAVRKDEDLRKLARYLVANPFRAGLVRHLNDYPFWNAVWL